MMHSPGRSQVNHLYAKILTDRRHKDVLEISDEEFTERRVACWRVGRVDAGKLNPATVLRYSETVKIDPYNIPGGAALSLLNELMDTAAIVGRG